MKSKRSRIRERIPVFTGVFCVALFVHLCAFTFRASAADFRVYAEPSVESAAVGQTFSVGLFVDSPQPLNAYSLRFTYDQAALELVGTNNARSLITVWQTTPTAYSDGLVVFQGAGLKPFSGTHGELLTIVFRAKRPGATTFGFKEAAVYLANGKGTHIFPDMV
ncbi:MAG TPA: cohesin domain-containing protein, partial [Candidatus Sulfotelmatobacter sp.]|nr:cohesin domain-containing protein [Candidatus Sulfotelmatobacter sp.]